MITKCLKNSSTGDIPFKNTHAISTLVRDIARLHCLKDNLGLAHSSSQLLN